MGEVICAALWCSLVFTEEFTAHDVWNSLGVISSVYEPLAVKQHQRCCSVRVSVKLH